jgi:hypothetical protein
MSDLQSAIERVSALKDATVRDMFALYSRYYDGTTEELFRHDLSGKCYVILLRDQDERLQGFSTSVVTEHRFDQKPVRIFFSGDTIIDHRFWGGQALPIAWLHLTARLKSEAPDTPLYWLLLTKGHRTYRYLRAFFEEFFPAHDHPIPAQEKALMAMFARERFGDAYDSDRNIVSFPTSHGHLKPTWAEIPDKDRTKPDVRYFLERNPRYAEGEELVCISEITSENLRPFARRLFDEALHNATPQLCPT